MGTLDDMTTDQLYAVIIKHWLNCKDQAGDCKVCQAADFLVNKIKDIVFSNADFLRKEIRLVSLEEKYGVKT